MKKQLLAVLLLFSACVPLNGGNTPVAEQPIRLFATPATRSWLDEFYACAARQNAVIALTDPASAQLTLRLGEPEEGLSQPAFQIGEEHIEVVVHPDSPLRDLTLEQARALFAGQASEDVQVWVFAAESDVQQVFNRQVMAGQVVTSLARLATSPEEMAEALSAETKAVGLLPGREVAGRGVRGVLILPSVPVLVIAHVPVEGGIQNLLACLQAE